MSSSKRQARGGVTGAEVPPVFTVTVSAKRSPRGPSAKSSSRSASMSSPVAVGGDDSETEVLKSARARLKAKWEAKIKTEGQQPWANLETLKLIY